MEKTTCNCCNLSLFLKWGCGKCQGGGSCVYLLVHYVTNRMAFSLLHHNLPTGTHSRITQEIKMNEKWKEVVHRGINLLCIFLFHRLKVWSKKMSEISEKTIT